VGRSTFATLATSARTDIDRQRGIDESRFSPQASLNARMRAVVVAHSRLRLREPGAGAELRQSLIDLAAVAELIEASSLSLKGARPRG
jgi:hypothetical protein